jgi:threonine dehydrogenase-like Zn-dependent dehydrogenase
MIETDVLIVGSGPGGSAAALALSTYGIRKMVVTKYRLACRHSPCPHHQSGDHGGVAGSRRRGLGDPGSSVAFTAVGHNEPTITTSSCGKTEQLVHQINSPVIPACLGRQ